MYRNYQNKTDKRKNNFDYDQIRNKNYENKENINYGNRINYYRDRNSSNSFKKLRYNNDIPYSSINKTGINKECKQQPFQAQKLPHQQQQQRQQQYHNVLDLNLSRIFETKKFEGKNQESPQVIDKIFYNEHIDSDDSRRLVIDTSRSSYTSSDSDDNRDKIPKQAKNLLKITSSQIKGDTESQVGLVRDLIKNLNSTINLFTSGEATQLPTLPGISLKNFGCISLPINVIEGVELVKLMRKDNDFSFYLNSTELEFKNELWNKQMDSFIDKISKDMGCKDKLEVRLDKMVLYQRGVCIKKRKDESVDNNHFAKLIVQLPSIYTGGEMSVYEKNKNVKKVLNFGQNSSRAAYTINYAVHQSYLEYEMKEILSGYRLVLIYNLYWVNFSKNSNLTHDYLCDRLAKCLSVLNESKVPLALVLDNKYNDDLFKSNNIDALMGIDNERYHLLKSASNQLSNDKRLEFYIISGCNLKDDGSLNLCDSAKIERFYDCGGRVYAGSDLNMKFELFFDIMDLNKNDKVNINDKNYWIKTSNEFGYKYFLVLWSKSQDLKFYFDISISFCVDKVLNLFNQSHKEYKEFESQFRRLVMLMIERKRKQDFNLTENQLEKILKVLISIRDASLAQIFVGEIMTYFTDKCCDSLAMLIKTFTWDITSNNKLEHLFLPITNKTFSRNCQLAKSLYKINHEKLVYPFYNNYIKPVLDSNDAFIKLNEFEENDAKKEHCKVYVDLIETTLLLYGKEYDALMSKMCDLLIDALKPKYFVNLLNYIVNRINNYASNKYIIRLFKHRAFWLDWRIKELEKFTWKMPNASISSFMIREFLRSDREEMVYKSFSSNEEANSFVKANTGFQNGYSIEMRVRGTYVYIKKTREYFDEKLKSLNIYKNELEQIKSLNLNFQI